MKYEKTILSGKCKTFCVPEYDELFPPSQLCHPFYTYHDKNFNKERYRYSSIPLHIGRFEIKFPKKVTNVLRLSLKKAGDSKIVLPEELSFLEEFIMHCCLYEKSFNKNFNKLFAHLTVEQKEVKKGEVQRTPGWHADGFQGSKFPIKHEIEHSYLWSNKYGTEFCPQPYFIDHIDDSKYMVFDEMSKQINEKNVLSCMDENIYVFDPYMVHRSPIMPEDTKKLLVRLTFEYRKLLDPNDTVNPWLKFKVPPRFDIRNRLGIYEGSYDQRMYGFKNKKRKLNNKKNIVKTIINL